MNPIIPLIIFSVISKQQGTTTSKQQNPVINIPTYFDTFQMELLLDKLHGAVDLLERVNKLNQIVREPVTAGNPTKKIKESVNTVKDMLPEGHKHDQLNSLAGTINTLSQFGDIQGLMQTVGPMLKMLSTSREE